MAIIDNRGYVVVDSDPNGITELQENHPIKKAVHMDGREWSFISTNVAGDKWELQPDVELVDTKLDKGDYTGNAQDIVDLIASSNNLINVEKRGASDNNTNNQNESIINSAIYEGRGVFIPNGINYDINNLNIDGDTFILLENGTIISSTIAFGGAESVKNHFLMRGSQEGIPARFHLEPHGNIHTGTQAKLDWMLDPYEDDTTQYRIFNIVTSNDYSQGTSGKAFLGTKNTGDNHYGINTMLNFGFNDDNSNGGAFKMVYMDHSDNEWRSTFKGAYLEEKPVLNGDFIVSNFKLYEVQTDGAIGSTRPTHNSGTVTHDGIDYEYVRDYFNSASNGDIKPVVLFGSQGTMPLFGFKTCGVQLSTDVLVRYRQQFRFLDSNNSQKYFAGVFTTGSFRIGATSTEYIDFNGSLKTLNITGLSYVTADKTIPDGNTTVDVRYAELIRTGNTSATTITGITGVARQKFRLVCSDEFTTIESNNSILLRGGNTRKLRLNEHIDFQVGTNGTTLVEVVSFQTRSLDVSNVTSVYDVSEEDYSRSTVLSAENVTVNLVAGSLSEIGQKTEIIFRGTGTITFTGCIVLEGKQTLSTLQNSSFVIKKISSTEYLLSGDLDPVV